jgi:hypothetical protein
MLGLVVLGLVLVLIVRAGARAGSSQLTACGSGLQCAPTTLPDPAHVDAFEIVPWVRKLALAADKGARLTSITVSDMNGGTVALSDTQSISYEFAASGTTLAITVKKDQTIVSRGSTPPGDPVADPGCSTKAAWATAVAQGLPQDTKATIVYRYHSALGGPAVDFSSSWKTLHLNPATCAVQ